MTNISYKKKNHEIEKIADFSFLLYLLTGVAFQHTLLSQFSLILFSLSISLLIVSYNFRVAGNIYFLFMIVFIFYNWLNIKMGFSIAPEASGQLLQTTIINLIILFLVYNYVILRNDPRRILKIYILASVLVAVSVVFISLPTLLNNRLGSNLGINANYMAINIGIAYLMSLYLFLKEKKRLYAWLSFLFVAVIILTASRKGLFISGFGSVFLLYLLFPGKRIKNTFYSIIVVSLLLFFMLNIPFLYNLIGVRIEAFLNFISGNKVDETSIETRDNLITYGWSMFLEKPLTGYGLDSFRIFREKYSHNNFIEILFSGGIIAFFLYYLNYLIVLLRVYLANKKNGNVNSLLFVILTTMLFLDYAMVTFYERAFLNVIVISLAFVKITTKNSVKIK